ncbi:Erv1/Alr family FAD-linked sulfhydryl oxidase [bacterium]|nr:Erv1/Alr family FAD-linked sulfhydryl oxidase [bacterium]
MIWFCLFLCVSSIRAYEYDWARLHSCLTPKDLKETVDDYLQHFPCLDCREHFSDMISQHPFPLEFVRTTEDARVWTWLTHNFVNVRLNKPWESFDIMLECQK